MKVIALLSLLGLAASFAPSQVGRVDTAQNALFDQIFGMDLFAPNKDVNDYGARSKKKITTGKIGSGSYVPAGLTAAEYQKIRDGEDKKKKANYDRNVKKAGVFEDYTEFYLKRGTDKNQKWKKSATLGHRMAKTKYDFDQVANDGKKYDGGYKR
mmetsp:Transcript_28172/g.68578  ORF Transcript_28172/g.68578 Transcript_28172/m.68578 type:complete len:155 (+) Transcript_28172:23-487(+)|eukprot:CAMPEP_0113625348 /NCGR_PEP_ID=MMETSP0017_2-20120614/13094_1 /TAXON_ID=2856 /ORGANISM="Cylindrotheca closterium" /LENGTH=154 /DNA_ID=CAMNT_0000535461 /DNA_START=38 /DNA_END=502 /DNA_ORIENTATION=+ /assembly_acc=CAM_ASM_000147